MMHKYLLKEYFYIIKVLYIQKLSTIKFKTTTTNSILLRYLNYSALKDKFILNSLILNYSTFLTTGIF